MDKKRFVLLAVVVILSLLVSACGGGGGTAGDNGGNTPAPTPPPAEQTDDGGEGKWQDGVYYAESAQFSDKSGWKELVGLRVENGRIIDVEWNAIYNEGGLDKKESSRQGKYGMQLLGGAVAEWHEQAEAAEQYLIETQDPAAFQVKDNGKTDAVSGVSVTVDEFVNLVNQALQAGPVEAGPYVDGTYYAEEPEYADSGWKYTATITVLNGRIIAADWNGISKDGGDDKDTLSKNGGYGMKAKGGAQAEWHEQAYLAEQYLIEQQDPGAITYTSDQGHTDAISGVSIHVSEFFTLADEALADAR